jgi:membrane protein YqaA with SNARE-associated domain
VRVPVAIRVLLATTAISAAIVVAVLAYLQPEREVVAAVIAAAATVLGGTLSVALGRYYEKAHELEEVTRQRKIEVYERFVGFWFKVLYAKKLGQQEPVGTEIMKWMVEFTEALAIWGSDDVIRSWGALRVKMAGVDASDAGRTVRTLLDFEALLIVMRRDVGYPDTTLRSGDLLRLFVDDAVAEMLPGSDHVSK